MRRLIILTLILITIAGLFTSVYVFIPFELEGIFSCKWQFAVLPGFIYLIVGYYYYKQGSISTQRARISEVHTLEQTSSELQESSKRINQKSFVMFAFFLSGALCFAIGFLL